MVFLCTSWIFCHFRVCFQENIAVILEAPAANLQVPSSKAEEVALITPTVGHLRLTMDIAMDISHGYYMDITMDIA